MIQTDMFAFAIWEKKYPGSMSRWADNWDCISPMSNDSVDPIADLDIPKGDFH